MWYTKEEIMRKYPMGITTYKKKIKKLNDSKYSNHTRLIRREIINSNLKYIIVREIHSSIIDEIFGDVRLPSKSNIDKVIKWVNCNKWDWFCNIKPSNAFPNELKVKIEFFFKRIKGSCSKGIKLFYTIEKNPKDNFYHCHFLIKTEGGKLDKKEIELLLSDVCEPNTKRENRIFVEQYNYEKFKSKGSDYSVKNMQIGYDLLSFKPKFY